MFRRFGIFFFGILLGVMIIRFAFPGRFTEYTQYFSLDYRVLYHLNQDTIYFSNEAQCLMECLDVEQADVLDVFEGGEVNFDLSDKNTTPCKLYLVEKDELEVSFELCEDKVKLKSFSLGEDTCSCN
ncbi:MAG: DUF4258 domain-containing protein [Flavobacteriales bacterium]|nr:DUF4258 domain-containing protein [Flavobacteriales bacterium]MBL6873159.1 DUF4258 domain-containing protein [Flavobacteriales bacterium]